MLRLTALPFLLALALYGSEPPKWERFELTDGRTLVGEYNPITEVFTVEGGVATLSVPGALIKSRAPADPSTPTTRKMTPEEKAAAFAVIAERKRQEAKSKLLSDATKMEAEADALQRRKIADPEERAQAATKCNALRRGAEAKRLEAAQMK